MIAGVRVAFGPPMKWGAGVALAVLRSIRSPQRLSTTQEVEDFEQELVDQYAVAMTAAGITDRHITHQRAVLFKFVRFLNRPMWTAESADADRYLVWLRTEQRQVDAAQRNIRAALALLDWLTSRGLTLATARQGDL
jgi:hypothetical protein